MSENCNIDSKNIKEIDFGPKKNDSNISLVNGKHRSKQTMNMNHFDRMEMVSNRWKSKIHFSIKWCVYLSSRYSILTTGVEKNTRSRANHIKMLSCIGQNDRIECFSERKKPSVWTFFGATSHSYHIRKYCKCLFWKCIQTQTQHAHSHTFLPLHAKKAVSAIDVARCCHCSRPFSVYNCQCSGVIGWFINDCLFFDPRILIIVMC